MLPFCLLACSSPIDSVSRFQGAIAPLDAVRAEEDAERIAKGKGKRRRRHHRKHTQRLANAAAQRLEQRLAEKDASAVAPVMPAPPSHPRPVDGRMPRTGSSLGVRVGSNVSLAESSSSRMDKVRPNALAVPNDTGSADERSSRGSRSGTPRSPEMLSPSISAAASPHESAGTRSPGLGTPGSVRQTLAFDLSGRVRIGPHLVRALLQPPPQPAAAPRTA